MKKIYGNICKIGFFYQRKLFSNLDLSIRNQIFIPINHESIQKWI